MSPRQPCRAADPGRRVVRPPPPTVRAERNSLAPGPQVPCSAASPELRWTRETERRGPGGADRALRIVLLGPVAKRYLDSGELVPDDIVIDIVSERLADPDCRHGFVLDGFPRSAPQASALSRRLDELGTPLDAAISLEVQEEELFQRLAARARADDTEQTIRNRLRVFAASNHPLLRYYEQRGLLARIDGVGDTDDLTELVVARLKDLMAHPIAERRRSAEVALASMVGR